MAAGDFAKGKIRLMQKVYESPDESSMAVDEIADALYRNLNPNYLHAMQGEQEYDARRDRPLARFHQLQYIYERAKSYIVEAPEKAKEYAAKAASFLLPDRNWGFENLPRSLWGYCMIATGYIGINEKLVGWSDDLLDTTTHEEIHRNDCRKIGNNLFEYVTEQITQACRQGRNHTSKPEYERTMPAYGHGSA